MSQGGRYIRRVQHALALKEAEIQRLLAVNRDLTAELAALRVTVNATIHGNNSLAARVGLSQATVDEMRARIKEEIARHRGQGHNGGLIL